ncbi:MAG: argininosuccinate lyase [Candidatus Diapherotrites archaeon]|nr:argininosuccinate lyase [Candidatus Diapherotrites archaeon]
MQKLWGKHGKKLDAQVEAFTVGKDFLLDMELLDEDCAVNEAHAKALAKAKIISWHEFEEIKKALGELKAKGKEGKFAIKPEQEDIHTAVENFLTEKLGAAGKKIHVGKSRNDQAAADLLLYSKKKLSELQEKTAALAVELEKFAEKNSHIKMPGYTHSRKAMPSTARIWAGSFVESLKDDIELMESVKALTNKSPLGAAAGYGTSLALDKGMVAKELGFAKVHENPLYAINSRDKYESAVLFSMCELMLTLNKLATDIIIFSGEHFCFLELPEEICTGSSIMPHKKNPDVFEILRAKNAEMQSYLFNSLVNQNSLPSGYNRDMQLGKEPLIRGFALAGECVGIALHVLPKIKVNEENCLAAVSEEMLSAEKAIAMAKKGVPFREAYKLQKT